MGHSVLHNESLVHQVHRDAAYDLVLILPFLELLAFVQYEVQSANHLGMSQEVKLALAEL